MKRRWLEACKSLMILLLVLCVIALAVMANYSQQTFRTTELSRFLTPVASLLGLETAETPIPPAAESSIADSTKPTLISVYTPAGRCSFYFDVAALDSVYESLGSLFGQALDTASAPETVSQTQWLQALSQESVLFSYDGSIPSGLLAAWLDAACAYDLCANQYVLSLEGDTVYLLTSGETFQRFTTQLSSQTLIGALESYLPDGTAFAFEMEDEKVRRLDPMTLWGSGIPTVYEAVSSNPTDAKQMERLATLLGFNPYDGSSYTDSQGSIVYNETSSTLQIDPNGYLVLTNGSQTNPRFLPADSSLQASVDLVKTMLDTICEDFLGDSRLYFSQYTQEGDTVEIAFDFFLSGIPVVFPSDHAATAILENGVLTELRVHLRTYTLTQTPCQLLPQTQAAAIARPGSLLRVRYADLGGDTLSAGWVAQN